MRLDEKVSESVDEVLGVAQGIVLEQLLFILFISDLFNTVGNHIVGYVDDPTSYVAIPRPLLCPQVMELLNQDFAAIYSW